MTLTPASPMTSPEVLGHPLPDALQALLHAAHAQSYFAPCRLLRALLAASLLAALAACAVSEQTPDWGINAVGHIQRFAAAYLKGDDRVAAREFQQARAELARTGRPAEVARAELHRCAARVASLDFSPCDGFASLQADATAAEQAYARYLQGQASTADIALLPETQRAAASAGAEALASIKDPLSRLLAAALQLRSGSASTHTIAQAVDTASQQGWRRPLLAWLGVQQRQAREQGDSEAAARIQRRIDLIAPPSATSQP